MIYFNKGRRGFALVDYLCGTAILIATIMSVSSLNMVKSRTLTLSRRRQSAIYETHSLLLATRNQLRDRSAFAKAAKLLEGKKEGEWALLQDWKDTKELRRVVRGASAKAEIRRVAGQSAKYLELRITVAWRWNKDSHTNLQLSTLICGGDA